MNIHKNVLSEKERKNILSFVKSEIKDLGSNYPGLQTHPSLHQNKKLFPLLEKVREYCDGYKIDKCWANFTKGDFVNWHTHPYDLSAVYYLQNKYNIGTLFLHQKSVIEVTECPQNSLLIFNSKLVHSVPIHLKEDRYSIAIDLKKI